MGCFGKSITYVLFEAAPTNDVMVHGKEWVAGIQPEGTQLLDSTGSISSYK
jgi:hypothetical protein